MKTANLGNLIAVTAAIIWAVTAAQAEIKIGVAGPLTGNAQGAGEQLQAGAQRAVADINANGGLLGQQLALISVDDGCEPKQAEAAARQLVSQGVAFVAGHYCSGTSIAASPIYEAAGIVMISPASTNPKVTEAGHKNVFRVCGRDDKQGVIAGDYLADTYATSKIAIVHDGSAYGLGLVEVTKKQLNQRGVTEVMYEGYVPEQKDYLSLVEKLSAAKADVLYVGGYVSDTALIIRQAKAKLPDSDITDLKQREEELTKKSNALEQLSNQLAKYLSPQIYNSIFSGKQEVKLVSQRKRLTVFFSDLAGFTETTERLESEDLTRLLNQYLTEMSQIAIAHGGTIDKFVGDAILIFFGDPETRGIKEDAVACVKMAISMRKRMKELEGVWKAAGLENPLRCRIGINTGVCTVGNFGSEDRMDYTIIGGGVNLAARLETACTVGEILISYETQAHVKDQIYCEEQSQITVKGIAHPVATYRVIDFYENLGEGNLAIRTKLPHFQLDVDVSLMSPEEKRSAAAALLEAAKRLSKTSAKK